MTTTTWSHHAERELAVLAAGSAPFTADDLLAIIGPPDPGHSPNGRNSAIGGLFAQWHKAGRIEVVGYRQSTSPSRKGGLIREWRGVPSPQRALW